MRTCEFTPDAPLGHHLDKVTGAELEGEIPSYAEHDDFLVKVPALKELLCRGGFRHRWPLTPQSQFFKFAPEPLPGYLGPIFHGGPRLPYLRSWSCSSGS